MTDEILTAPLPPMLRELLARDRLPHALLLEGEKGTPLKETALAVAAAALCERNDGTACGHCIACRKILDLSHSDVIIVDNEADKDSFRKANVRELRAEAYRRPVEGRIKLYIFLHAEELDPEVQSLLLKITEEPPADTCFLLTTHNRFRLLPTILSRVTTVQLPPLTQARRKALCEGDAQGAALLRDAETAAQALLQNDGYAFLTLAASYEKNRSRYTQLLETMLPLTPDPQLHLLLLDALRLADANGHLPLVSALLAARREQRG